MMNKVLYYMGLICDVLFLIMVCVLLPIILKSGWQGILFLVVTVIYFFIRLLTLILGKEKIEKIKGYLILIIALFFYMGIIFTRIMLVTVHTSSLYQLSMKYCQNNFFLISITMICITLNTILILSWKEKKKAV